MAVFDLPVEAAGNAVFVYRTVQPIQQIIDNNQSDCRVRQKPFGIVQPYAGNEHIVKVPEADRRESVQPEIRKLQHAKKVFLFFRILSGAYIADPGGNGAEKRIHQSGNVFF